MALADPQSVTVNAVAVSLPRTGFDPIGTFTSANRKHVLTISHEAKARFRSQVKLRFDDTVADPMVPDRNIPVNATAYLVIDYPKNGIDTVTVAKLVEALVDWLNDTNITKVVTGEQ